MMLHKMFEDGEWFEPKCYGYGAGRPIAWQGWAVLGAYLLAVTGASIAIAATGSPAAVAGGAGFLIAATGVLFVIVRNHTRGGWRWRWGERD